MPVNLFRGFRRIGWVLTFPLAAFVVLLVYERTNEYSPSKYEAWENSDNADIVASKYGGVPEGQAAFAMPGLGVAHFSREVSKDIVEMVLNDFKAKQKLEAANPSPPPKMGEQQGKYGFADVAPKLWTFAVHKQVSKLRLAGLILGSILISALIIQGSISILAWIFRGFRR